MSKLYFYYGAMNSGKTAALLLNVHNYEEQGKKVIILKPESSTREEAGKVISRVGLSHDAIDFKEGDNLYTLLARYIESTEENLDCIFVDEVNFATREQIKQLVQIVDLLNIPVICYGLKNSYVDGELFESIKVLLYEADSVTEIKSVCTYCNSKATHHLRIVNGHVITKGEKNIVGDIKGGEEKYISVCRKCYHKHQIKEDEIMN